jgi:hypothetical protein
MRCMRFAALAFLSLALASCGGSSTDGGDKTLPFVGTWTVTTGSLTAMCPAPLGTMMQALDGGQQAISKATDGSLSVTILPGCSVSFDPSGNTATLRTSPPQTCMLTVMGIQVMGTFTSGSFMVTDKTATFSYAGNASLSGLLNCPVTASGTAALGAAADAGAPAGSDAGSD